MRPPPPLRIRRAGARDHDLDVGVRLRPGLPRQLVDSPQQGFAGGAIFEEGGHGIEGRRLRLFGALLAEVVSADAAGEERSVPGLDAHDLNIGHGPRVTIPIGAVREVAPSRAATGFSRRAGRARRGTCPFCGGGEAPGPAPAPGPGPDRRPPGGRGGAAMSSTFEEGQKRPCTAISHPGRGLSPDRALETGAAEPGRRGAVPGAPIGVDAGDVRNALDELAAGAPG